MKSCLLFALLSCSIPVFSQHIKFSEFDSATSTRRIATTSQWVNKELGSGFAVAFRSEDTAVFVQLSLFPNANALVAEGNELIFQLEDNSIVVARSKGMQVHTGNYNTPFEYRIALQDIKALLHHGIRSISYYTANGKNNSFTVQPTNQNDLQQTCNVFVNEYQNYPAITDHTAKLIRTK